MTVMRVSRQPLVALFAIVAAMLILAGKAPPSDDPLQSGFRYRGLAAQQ
jgi:hypothetical protein